MFTSEKLLELLQLGLFAVADAVTKNRGEVTEQVWLDKVAEIKGRYE